MGVTNVFARTELKYRLTAAQDRFLRETLAPYVEPDQYGESTICNIYYDTPDFRLIRKSIEKPVYKEKLRLRSYGPAGPDDNTFLELKKKYKGIVYKRRICLPEQDAMNYLSGKSPLLEENQISKELDWFLDFYGNLQPAVYLNYDRTAFYSKEDPDLRITFDRNIHFRTDDLQSGRRHASVAHRAADAGGCEEDLVLEIRNGIPAFADRRKQAVFFYGRNLKCLKHYSPVSLPRRASPFPVF